LVTGNCKSSGGLKKGEDAGQKKMMGSENKINLVERSGRNPIQTPASFLLIFLVALCLRRQALLSAYAMILRERGFHQPKTFMTNRFLIVRL
jgi:hypothetical protein